ncbi:MAG: YbaB/EbfC family nucleoid-associated protein [Patescibacteria group bacterium]|jgi:DNA-binding protein YbaB
MFQKLKQFKDMRDESKKMKAMLDEIVIVGSGAGGKVMITMNGSHEVMGVTIEDGLEKARIEQGVKEAMADVNKKLQGELMKKMQAMGGLGAIGDMMKGMGGS